MCDYRLLSVSEVVQSSHVGVFVTCDLDEISLTPTCAYTETSVTDEFRCEFYILQPQLVRHLFFIAVDLDIVEALC